MLVPAEIDGAVTHTLSIPHPVCPQLGKVVTPGKGKPMYVATTWASDTDRINGMVRVNLWNRCSKADSVENQP